MPKHYDVFAIRKETNRATIFYFVIATYFICGTVGDQDAYPVMLWFHPFVYIIETAGFTLLSTLYPRYEMTQSVK